MDTIADVGSDRGGQRAAFMYSLIVTAKLNDADRLQTSRLGLRCYRR
jgi:hypothetical protein